ncbi:MAG: hypothetical protein OMM_06075 [Candidatus Magnetoglobus multicellularis str. Araruama]|uniref:SSD domain-containing protein n=1 Tax=Candidatus Magnetoglobus multicellularis str. Araruama TaxID=890399 RepID=A0A1V1NS12_9BACT|nr:MAG: hypothetical protein OMM_06075 [Candidatus Magnetoglobus multicellularis str. Araruama]
MQTKYQVKAGLAGLLVLQRDEMAATEKDIGKTSLLSLILILIIFIAGFKLIRYSVLAVIPLIIGIIWALGLTWLLVGSLNPMTAMMSAILIGLGIDYAIHIIALYTEERQQGVAVKKALVLVYKKTVKGIITGSITTAIGFMAFGFSSFPGFSEFGIVLGIGIISVLLASVLVLPALLMILGTKKVKVIKQNQSLLFKLEKIIIKRPWVLVSLVVILSILAVLKFNDLEFSKNIKDIEPKNLESLVMNDKIIEKFNFTSDVSIAISNTLEQTREIKK